MARILVIDDEKTELDVIKRFLTEQGHEVSILVGGNIKLSKIISKKPELIVLDVIMPGVDGWTLGYMVKRNPLLCDIPVLMLSGYWNEPFDGWNSAADAYMQKPLKRKLFVETVNNMLGLESGQKLPGTQSCSTP